MASNYVLRREDIAGVITYQIDCKRLQDIISALIRGALLEESQWDEYEEDWYDDMSLNPGHDMPNSLKDIMTEEGIHEHCIEYFPEMFYEPSNPSGNGEDDIFGDEECFSQDYYEDSAIMFTDMEQKVRMYAERIVPPEFSIGYVVDEIEKFERLPRLNKNIIKKIKSIEDNPEKGLIGFDELRNNIGNVLIIGLQASAPMINSRLVELTARRYAEIIVPSYIDIDFIMNH